MDTRQCSRPGGIPGPGLTAMRAAAMRALQVHPGPVGELLARELRAYADFGHRFGMDGLLHRIATEIMASAEPAPASRPPARIVHGREIRRTATSTATSAGAPATAVPAR